MGILGFIITVYFLDYFLDLKLKQVLQDGVAIIRVKFQQLRTEIEDKNDSRKIK